MHPLASGALLEIAGDPPRVDRASLEALAEHAHNDRQGEGPEGLAEGQGAEVQYDDGFPEGLDGLSLADGLLIVRRARDRATEWLRVLHELAHWMLRRVGWAHSHGDVWLLTFALGAPLSLVRRVQPRCGIELAAASGLPAWAAFARMEIIAAA